MPLPLGAAKAAPQQMFRSAGGSFHAGVVSGGDRTEADVVRQQAALAARTNARTVTLLIVPNNHHRLGVWQAEGSQTKRVEVTDASTLDDLRAAIAEQLQNDGEDAPRELVLAAEIALNATPEREGARIASSLADVGRYNKVKLWLPEDLAKPVVNEKLNLGQLESASATHGQRMMRSSGGGNHFVDAADADVAALEKRSERQREEEEEAEVQSGGRRDVTVCVCQNGQYDWGEGQYKIVKVSGAKSIADVLDAIAGVLKRPEVRCARIAVNSAQKLQDAKLIDSLADLPRFSKVTLFAPDSETPTAKPKPATKARLAADGSAERSRQLGSLAIEAAMFASVDSQASDGAASAVSFVQSDNTTNEGDWERTIAEVDGELDWQALKPSARLQFRFDMAIGGADTTFVLDVLKEYVQYDRNLPYDDENRFKYGQLPALVKWSEELEVPTALWLPEGMRADHEHCISDGEVARVKTSKLERQISEDRVEALAKPEAEMGLGQMAERLGREVEELLKMQDSDVKALFKLNAFFKPSAQLPLKKRLLELLALERQEAEAGRSIYVLSK